MKKVTRQQGQSSDQKADKKSNQRFNQVSIKTFDQSSNQIFNQSSHQTSHQTSNLISTKPFTQPTKKGHKVPIVSGIAIANGNTASEPYLELLKQNILSVTSDPHRACIIAGVIGGDLIAAKHEVITNPFLSSKNYGLKTP